MQGETKFKTRIRPDLDALPFSWWVKTQMVALRGIPDFLGCLAGLFIAIELKVDGEDASKLQGWVLRKIVAAGGIGIVATPADWPEIYAKLKELSASIGRHEQRTAKLLAWFRSRTCA